jgi:hypothetical protein
LFLYLYLKINCFLPQSRVVVSYLKAELYFSSKMYFLKGLLFVSLFASYECTYCEYYVPAGCSAAYTDAVSRKLDAGGDGFSQCYDVCLLDECVAFYYNPNEAGAGTGLCNVYSTAGTSCGAASSPNYYYICDNAGYTFSSTSSVTPFPTSSVSQSLSQTITQTPTSTSSQTPSTTSSQTATSTISQTATQTSTSTSASTKTPTLTPSPSGTPVSQGLTAGQQGAIAGGVVGGMVLIAAIVVASVMISRAAGRNKGGNVRRPSSTDANRRSSATSNAVV